MPEFLFSHEILAKQFVDIAKSYHIKSKLIVKRKGWEVHLTDDFGDLTLKQLNDYYSDLSRQDYEMSLPVLNIESPATVITIEVLLENGEIIETQLNTKLWNKLTSILNHDETNLLLSSIASAIHIQKESTN